MSKIMVGLFIMIGLIASGYLVGEGVQKFRMSDRTVHVKGLAEREVTADFAILPFNLTATDNDLLIAQKKIESDQKNVIDFLIKKGVKREEIEIHQLQVTDAFANTYSKTASNKPRYIITVSITITTGNVQLIKQISQESGDLVKLGIVLTDNRGPNYYFKGLNSIKPEMVAEATKNARAAAEKFAIDSGSQVGAIRRANQGTITIRDTNSNYSTDRSVNKTVRIVSTIVYDLD